MSPEVDALRAHVWILEHALAEAERRAAAAHEAMDRIGREAQVAHAQAGAAAALIADAQLRAAEAVERARIELRARRLDQADAERRAMEATIERDLVFRSTLWRASAPVRILLNRTPAVRRTMRRSAKLAWSLGALRRRSVVPAVMAPPAALAPPAGTEPALPAPLGFAPLPGFDTAPAPTLPPARPGWPGADDKARVTAVARSELHLFLHAGARIAFPRRDAPTVSVVVVLWNAAALTLRCLRALQAHAGPGVEVVLFDNGSTDETAALLARVDGAVVIRHGGNAGFVIGCNRGVAASRGAAVLLLNSDAILRPGTLPAALATLHAGDDVGAVGARIVLPDGFLQEAGSIVWADAVTAGFGRGRPADWQGAMFRRDVDYCSGAFLLTRRATWDALGGFDERFSPAYYEEADFCMRLHARGLRVVYEPRAAIDHFEFGSQSGGEQAHALSVRNRKLFRARHADALQARHLPRDDANVQPASVRPWPGRRRLLVIDDRPVAGAARTRAMVRHAVQLGWAVTLYAPAPGRPDWAAIREVLPWEVEVVTGPDAPAPGIPGLAGFLTGRDGAYEAMLVPGDGAMAAVRAVFALHPHLPWGIRLVYDAPALDGHPDRADRLLTLADGADAIGCTDPAAAAAFGRGAEATVRVLGDPGDGAGFQRILAELLG